MLDRLVMNPAGVRVRTADQAAGLRRLFGRRVRVLPLVTPDGGGDQAEFAINLAAAMTRLGHRTLLLDGERGRIAPRLGLKARYDLWHLLNGDPIAERVMLPAPDGFWVVPAARGLMEVARRQVAARTLISGLGGLGGAGDGLGDPRETAFDTVLACATLESLAPVLADHEAEVLLPCGTAPWQVARVYARIKALRARHGVHRFRLVYCPAESRRVAVAAHRRLMDAADRFLSVTLAFGGMILDEPAAQVARRRGVSVFSVQSDSAVARAFDRIAAASLGWPVAEVDTTRVCH